MTQCKNCKHCKNEICLNPKIEEFVERMTGFTSKHIGWPLAFIRLSVCLGNWFEPYQPNLPEGYRFITEEENKHGKIQAGDKIWDGNAWQDYEQRNVGQPFSDTERPKCRHIVPALAKCPDGHIATMSGNQHYGYVVNCGNADCSWCSSRKATQTEAATAWNKAIGKTE